MFKQTTLETSTGSRIAVYTAGEGTQVFVLGGFSGRSIIDTPLSTLLVAVAKFGARVTMMDLSGAGRSRFSGDLSMELMLTDIADTYRQLGAGRSIGVGASFGGWLLVLQHRRNPGWFHSMCALAPAFDWDATYLLPEIEAGRLTVEAEVANVHGASVPMSFIRGMAPFHVLGAPFELASPLHIIHGDLDRVAPASASRTLAAQARKCCTLELMPNDDHSASALGSEQSMTSFARWLRGELDRIDRA